MLNKYGGLEENASLETYNTYGIKTQTKYLVKPYDLESLKELLLYLDDNKIPYYILGKGSNVILPDNSFSGFIISLENLNDISINDNEVTASSGVLLGLLIKKAINNNLEGLEYLYGIPGTLGGALFGNAGAYNHTIYDYLESINVLRNNELITLKKEDIKIAYRYTEFKDNNDIIISATFKLNKNYNVDIQDIIKEISDKRKNNLPLEFKNAGSVFKNPENDYAGRLIESVGLKGFRVNDAQISLKHANFIVNLGNMKGSDIRELINIVKEKVYNEYKIKLELEQIIIDWD